METVADTALVQNGYVSSAQATAAGIPRRCLAEAVEAGELVQVDRGLLPPTTPITATARSSKSVI